VVPVPDRFEVSTMKRGLTTAACTALLALVAAGTASAAVSYDPAAQTGFISRGEVIAAAGKGALIVDPMVLFTSTTRYTLTCNWPDQTQRQVALERTAFVLFRATTRYAGGTDQITGYSLAPGNIVDGGAAPPVPDATICWSLLGTADDGTPVVVQQLGLTQADSLVFFGPTPVQLPFT
jgi:hypothetical protein